jgi:hypothetical protein
MALMVPMVRLARRVLLVLLVPMVLMVPMVRLARRVLLVPPEPMEQAE